MNDIIWGMVVFVGFLFLLVGVNLSEFIWGIGVGIVVFLIGGIEGFWYCGGIVVDGCWFCGIEVELYKVVLGLGLLLVFKLGYWVC